MCEWRVCMFECGNEAIAWECACVSGGYSLGMSVEGVMWECGGCTCVSGRLCMVSMEGVHVCVEGVQVCVEGCMCECGGCAWRVRRMCMRVWSV